MMGNAGDDDEEEDDAFLSPRAWIPKETGEQQDFSPPAMISSPPPAPQPATTPVESPHKEEAEEAAEQQQCEEEVDESPVIADVSDIAKATTMTATDADDEDEDEQEVQQQQQQQPAPQQLNQETMTEPLLAAVVDFFAQTDPPSAPPALVDAETQAAAAAATTTEQACKDCDKLRAVLTVRADAEFGELQEQWRMLSKMFNKFEYTCQQVLKAAGKRRAELEEEHNVYDRDDDGDDDEQQQHQKRFRLDSDIRSGTLKIVEAEPRQQPQQPQDISRSATPSAIDQMRQRASASACNSANTSRSSSVVHHHATPLAAHARQQPQQQHQQQQGGGPLHFVALRKCVVNQPDQQQHQLHSVSSQSSRVLSSMKLSTSDLENSVPRR